MSDQVTVVDGALPWRPSFGISDYVVLSHYDMPLAGMFMQNGTHFLFQCVIGQLESFHLWVYSPLTDSERHELEGLEGAALGARLDRLIYGRDVTVVFADDEDGILFRTVFRVNPPASLVDFVRRALVTARRRIESMGKLAAEAAVGV